MKTKTKKTIRDYLVKRRGKLDEDFVQLNSEIIKKKLLKLDIFRRSDNIGLYFSKDNEIDTNKLIFEIIDSKKVFLPKINEQDIEFREFTTKDELKKGKFGIIEPIEDRNLIDPKKLDAVIVPGVGFDAKGGRIGRGLGYYDRFLKKIQTKIPIVALAFDFQILDVIPTEKNDVPVDIIITERRTIIPKNE